MNRAEHAEYVAGAVWAARRERFKSEHGRRCRACDSDSRPNVHHVRYDNWGAGHEPDRDLLVLCEEHHKLAHRYEKSGRYGAFMAKGTLAAATKAMIADVRAGAPAKAGSGGRAARSTPSHPPIRRDRRRPGSGSARPRRRKGSTGFSKVAGAVLTVLGVFVVIGIAFSRTSQTPTQQPPLATISVASVVPVLSPPAPVDPYLVQQGDTLQQIADRSGLSLADLVALNPDIIDPNYIEVGQAVVTAPPR